MKNVENHKMPPSVLMYINNASSKASSSKIRRVNQLNVGCHEYIFKDFLLKTFTFAESRRLYLQQVNKGDKDVKSQSEQSLRKTTKRHM